jgi:glycosyltransferase involved in cell wall biosynthesis
VNTLTISPDVSANVSVIMPTWNRAQYLPAAIDSVLTQTLPIRELIIADDGSDAATRELLAQYAARPRVRVIWLTHCGNPGAVRNAAIRESSGQYLAFADSDDVWYAEKLQRQFAALHARPACRWSYTSATFMDEQDRSIPPPGDPDQRYRAASLLDALASFETGIALPTVIVERALLLEAGLFDESLRNYEDCDLWLRLAARSEAAAIREPLVKVRLHDAHFSRQDPRAALTGRESFLARAIGQVRTPAVRTRLKRMRALDAARLANLAAAAGDAGEASDRLRASVVDGWSMPLWWLIAARAQSRLWTRRARGALTRWR